MNLQLPQHHYATNLYHKAKALHWNPQDLDLSQDTLHWQALDAQEQQALLTLLALFAGGEWAVTHELSPMLAYCERQRLVPEGVFVITQIYEEAKHAEFFERFLSEVVVSVPDLNHLRSPAYHELFEQRLPQNLAALRHSDEPAAIMLALGTYHFTIEGVLAETGYHVTKKALAERDILPGLRAGMNLVQRDEARHIAFGLQWLARYKAQHPELWERVSDEVVDMVMCCGRIVTEALSPFDPPPFGLAVEELVDYALRQFAHRGDFLERPVAEHE
jgi:ribonucleoside-diphosphate reductase beta chain